MKTIFILCLAIALVTCFGCGGEKKAEPAKPEEDSKLIDPAKVKLECAEAYKNMPSDISKETGEKLLRLWFDCQVKGDGGTYYDMLHSSFRGKLDEWFTGIQKSPKFTADPQSKLIKTARDFMIYSFELAKRDKELLAAPSGETITKILATGKYEGLNIAYTGDGGQSIIFWLEGGQWFMAPALSQQIVENMIKEGDAAYAQAS